ncbi:MAG: hypothetical protein HN507_05500 [Flavobacteriaceae bacterium]|jgi:hypothetical protein|nr:hypothetical protein [Flavobacteriaceae bacterium]
MKQTEVIFLVGDDNYIASAEDGIKKIININGDFRVTLERINQRSNNLKKEGYTAYFYYIKFMTKMEEFIRIAKLTNKQIQILNKLKIWVFVSSCINNNLKRPSTLEKIELCHSI